MLDIFKGKLKRLLGGAPKDTLTDRANVAPVHIDRVKIGMSTTDFEKKIAVLIRILMVNQKQIEYRTKHLGMTSYQKWYKCNKKWR